jgi:hypothetical protein
MIDETFYEKSSNLSQTHLQVDEIVSEVYELGEFRLSSQSKRVENLTNSLNFADKRIAGLQEEKFILENEVNDCMKLVYF